MIATSTSRRQIRTPDGAMLNLEGTPAAASVLLLHGLGYASWSAGSLRDLQAPGLWSLDNRGTGRSTRGSSPVTIGLLADDAARAIEVIGGPATVVGYSMGGYIAQLLAARRPELVDALVLLGTSAGGEHATGVPESTRQAWLDAAGSDPADYARRTMPLSFRAGWPTAHPGQYEAILQNRLRTPTPADVWRAQYDACEEFLRDGYEDPRLGEIPTVIVHGASDRVIPVENGRALAGLIPRARYIEIPDAGHLIHLEEPELIAREVDALTVPSTHTTIKKE